MNKTLDVRRMAGILNADAQLEDIERLLRRGGDWRMARKIGAVREALGQALLDEQIGLHAMLAEFIHVGELKE
jgi:hypothetical protein